MKKIYNLLLFTVLAAGSQLAPATKRKRMLPALPPGTCKSSRGRPRRLRAAGRSTAPGNSGSWHSKTPARIMSIYRTFRSAA